MVSIVLSSGRYREAWGRFTFRWWLKTIGITAYITGFMFIYFTLLRHPQFPVTVMPLTAVDRAIPFAPWSLFLYATLWIYISLVPGMLWSWSEMREYLLQVSLLSLLGFVIFLFWPTEVPAELIDWSHDPAVAFLKSVDAAGNACPSLHVAFAVLSALWLQRLLSHVAMPLHIHLINWLWCLGILYSTLATKQHVALDLYAGVAAGLAVALLRPPPAFSSAPLAT
ncbi:MAG TPA: phosphatase PAP2 family protein [Gammaproteobacteria bacterium]|nr:phosphatase PAP2 family protein [Gammaproteobacteria bacterium]